MGGQFGFCQDASNLSQNDALADKLLVKDFHIFIRNLAARMSPEVDIIVGAHSHTLLFNGETPNGDIAASEYPTVVTQSNGHRVSYN